MVHICKKMKMMYDTYIRIKVTIRISTLSKSENLNLLHAYEKTKTHFI